MVSSPTGQNSNWLPMSSYFVIFLFSAASAVDPAFTVDIAKFVKACVSTTVTSHTSSLPFFEGTCVIPSGRFLSFLKTLGGSRNAVVNANLGCCQRTFQGLVERLVTTVTPPTELTAQPVLAKLIHAGATSTNVRAA
ncbi:hypothetical protein RvY_19230 [Ramazzottius varieornatus]|uniref:Uncharacterized protein n=1 Tax=Ramazzottius varieornatus TaxID=947166 RepID=A0A1D1W8P5_RAMVA|nr:hypothetical protein RvY_19230 [Ramazzottius varieornatus]